MCARVTGVGPLVATSSRVHIFCVPLFCAVSVFVELAEAVCGSVEEIPKGVTVVIRQRHVLCLVVPYLALRRAVVDKQSEGLE